MADPKIRIPIELPAGDMSGAENVKREIDAVVDKAEEAQKSIDEANPMSRLPEAASEAAEEVDALAESFAAAEEAVADLEESVESMRQAQREADVDAAERLKAERELNEEMERTQAAIAKQAARAAVLGGIATLASATWGSLTSAMEEYRRLAPDDADRFREPFDTIELAIQTVQSPIETLIEGIKGTQQSLRNLAASQAEAAKQEAQLLETRARKEAELEAASTRRINNFVAGSLRGIEEQTAAYERQLRVLAAVAELEEKRAVAADAKALANGADPASVAAGAAARGALSAAGDEDERVKESERAVEKAISAFKLATEALDEARNDGNLTRERFEELSVARDEAQRDIENAEAELATVREVAQLAKEGIAVQTEAEFAGVVQGVGEKISSEAEKAIAVIEGKATEQGGRLSGLAQQSLDTLYELIRDKIPDEQQVDRIAQAMTNFQNSSEAKDDKTFAAIQLAITAVRARDQQIDDLLRQARELNRRVSALGG